MEKNKIEFSITLHEKQGPLTSSKGSIDSVLAEVKKYLEDISGIGPEGTIYFMFQGVSISSEGKRVFKSGDVVTGNRHECKMTVSEVNGTKVTVVYFDQANHYQEEVYEVSELSRLQPNSEPNQERSVETTVR